MSLPASIHQPSGGVPSFGVVLRLHISDRFYPTEIQVAAAATSDATVPLTTTARRLVIKSPGVIKHAHILPNDDKARHYRARHLADGIDPGGWTDWVCAKPKGLAVDPDGGPPRKMEGGIGDGEPGDSPSGFEGASWSEGRRRNDTIYSADARIKNTVRITDTSANFLINRHNETGQAQDGDSVVFARDFESTPQVTFVPQIGLTYQSTDSTSAQTIELKAENLTISGFDVRAKITPGSAGTAITDGWSTAQNATAPETGDVTLSADGDAAFCNLEDANANVTTYSAWYDVAATSMAALSLVKVELWSNNGAASTTWTLRDSQVYDNGDSLTDESLDTTLAMDADYDFQLVISYIPSAPATSQQATITAHGESHVSEPGMQYVKITGGTPQPMTPNVGDAVAWFALEAP